MLKKYFCYFFILGLVACGRQTKDTLTSEKEVNKFQDLEICKIYDLKDQRDTDALLPYLRHENITYRAEAAYAFGSVQDIASSSSLLNVLKEDSIMKVQQAAVFALGQLGTANLQEELIGFLEQQSAIQSELKATVLEAIGKCSTGRGLDFLLSLEVTNEKERLGLMLAMNRAFMRGLFSKAAIDRLVNEYTLTTQPKTKEIIATALGKVKDKKVLTLCKTELLKLYYQGATDVAKSSLLAVLSRINPDDEVRKVLVEVMADEKSNAVLKVNAIRGLSVYDDEDVKESMLEAMNSENVNVAVTASNYFARNITEEEVKPYTYIAKNIKNTRARATFLRYLLRVSPENKALDKLVKGFYKSTDNLYEQGQLLKAIAESPYNYPFLKQVLKDTESPVLVTTVMEGLIQIRRHKENFKKLKRKYPKVEKEFADIFRKAIESRDIAQIYYAAGMLRNPEYNYRKWIKDYAFLEDVMLSLQMPRDVEAYIELQKTLSFFREEINPKHQLPIFDQNTINWAKVRQVSPQQGVTVSTSKGDFEMLLLVNTAPATVSLFLDLVEKGFYDNKVFHRVVPNFVVQGGCTRGDGFGGLDETIRSEFSHLNFMSGAVGVASAGKDTESCQWFVSHIPTLRLDGRYTLFAYVTEGIDIVRSLDMGDIIYEIQLTEMTGISANL